MDFFDFLKNEKFILLAISLISNILLILACGTLTYAYVTHECICEEKESIANVTEQIENDKSDNFYVEIKGAVKKPGVYVANNQNIINDIVKMAGGFAKKAYTKNINLSKKVVDELVIYVFTENEYKKDNTKVITKVVQESCECSTYDISNCTDNKVSEIISSEKDTIFEEHDNNESNVVSSKLVNINTASKEELMTLSGIGESKAVSIIEYRKNSIFKNIEELKNVSGIGEALYNKVKDSITV